MEILFANQSVSFAAWHPTHGRVFEKIVAMDTETTRLDEERLWLTPAYVLGAAFDGERGVFIQRQHAADFLRHHEGVRLVLHNAPFDLAVLHSLAPQLDIYRWVDQHRVWDTQLLHRLLVLGTEGHTASGKGQSTLEHCAERYLGIPLAKDVVDSDGDVVRLSYGKLLNRRPHDIGPVYLQYLAEDTIATFKLYHVLRARLRTLRDESTAAFGYVSAEWLTDQIRRWGWQTHHIQLKAAIVLRAITAEGLHLDLERRQELATSLGSVLEEKRKELRKLGYQPGHKGCAKALQEILRRLERQHPEVSFARTATQKYATSEEALESLAGLEPFITTLVEYRGVEKLLNTYLEKMVRPVLHPSFDVLKNTGRTSSFGELNAQNLPRDPRVRACFIPPPQSAFLDADYATVELATLAEAVQQQFDQPSAMAEAINSGQDLHRLVAAHVTGKSEKKITKTERQKAKPINFGKPGGMGTGGLQRYAKASYGVKLTDEEVEQLTDTWFDLFPEMRAFLGGLKSQSQP